LTGSWYSAANTASLIRSGVGVIGMVVVVRGAQ
jgi:hypothetical protein